VFSDFIPNLLHLSDLQHSTALKARERARPNRLKIERESINVDLRYIEKIGKSYKRKDKKEVAPVIVELSQRGQQQNNKSRYTHRVEYLHSRIVEDGSFFQSPLLHVWRERSSNSGSRVR